VTAATKNRNTPSRAGLVRGYPIAASVHAFAGAIGVLNASGFAEPATAATGKIALGRFSRELDNTSGADGADTIELERGCFRYANSAGADEIALTDVGQLCYLVDDQTVALTDDTGARSVAGIIDHVDENGVWVMIDPTSGAAL
jgi:hypothetical protein